MKTWLLFVVVFGGADGGRAITMADGFSETSCKEAVALIKQEKLYSAWGAAGINAFCINRP